MKKVIMFAAAALSMLACQKESVSNDGGLKLTATIEQQVEDVTRTALESSNSVVWSTGDMINVFTNAATPEKVTMALCDGSGTTSGTFHTEATPAGSPQYAIYPADQNNSISDKTISFTIPAEQTYAVNSFGNGANIAVAKVVGGNMEFKNVCGILKLTLKGGFTVSRIELSGNSDEKLNGVFSVDASLAKPIATGGDAANDAEKVITLNCGPSGVALDSTGVTFHFVAPANAFTNGFFATVYDIAGDEYYVEVSTTEVNTINRSKVRVMPTCSASRLLPVGYTELSYIESKNNDSVAYSGFITNLTPSNIFGYYLHIELDAMYYDHDKNFFGARIDSKDTRMTGGMLPGYYLAVGFGKNYYGTTYTIGKSGYINAVYMVNFKNSRNAYTNGVKLDCILPDISDIDFSKTCSFRLFSSSGGSTYAGRNYRLYNAIFTNGSNITKYYVPARRVSDSKLGLYDIENDNFEEITVVSKETYTAGPAI